MKQNKTLQKLTDYENINSVSELENYLELYPDKKREVADSIQQRLIDSYQSNEKDEFTLTEMYVSLTKDEEAKKEIRNTTYEMNHATITGCIHNFLCHNRRFPTTTEIKNKTNLSRQTIYNHLNNGLMTSNNRLVKGKNEIMTISALEKLYLIGIEDNNPTALKHFIQLSGLTANNNAMQVNNYIQINNLKISTEDIKRLPAEDILQIEKIVSKTLLIE